MQAKLKFFMISVFSPAEAPKLAHETFRAIKPGLSAYADEPEKVQLLSLLVLLVQKIFMDTTAENRTILEAS